MKIKVWVCTKYVGSKDTRTFEIDDEDWENMDTIERYEHAKELIDESNMIEFGYSEGEKE